MQEEARDKEKHSTMSVIRKRFVSQLEHLSEDLLHLGHLVEDALSTALKSLETWDTALAEQVIQDDVKIDEARHKLENWSIRLIATQQPVASDLRLIGSVFAIASELERIGDYAKHIARRVKRTSTRTVLVPPPAGINDMAAIAQKMLHMSLEAFLRQDSTMAYNLVQYVKHVGEWEQELRSELITLARENPARMESMHDMLDIVHALDRLAERAINIGERVVYLETSTMEDLHP